MLTSVEKESHIQTAFSRYQIVRDYVLDVLNLRSQHASSTSPSEYWMEELFGFDYLLEASPLLIQKLRQQSYHITGLKIHDYRSTQTEKRLAFEQKLKALKSIDKNNLFVPESPLLGGFGHLIDGKMINIDTLKFYEVLLALEKGGILESLRNKPKSWVLEIGPGWGGFAYQLKTLFPQLTFVLVDLPEVFLFSGTYLLNAFPNASVAFCRTPEDVKKCAQQNQRYDFVFIPQEISTSISSLPLDLAINMISFQEMTADQVRNYGNLVKQSPARWLYSLNRDRSSHNHQIDSVSKILSSIFETRELNIMNGAYTDLKAMPYDEKKIANFKRFLKNKIRTLMTAPEKDKREWSRYRHVIATRQP